MLIEINVRPENALKARALSVYQKITMQSLLKRVSRKLVLKHENVGKEVDNIMSGYILRAEADDSIKIIHHLSILLR